MKILALIFAFIFPLPGFVPTVIFAQGAETGIFLTTCEGELEETIPMDCPPSEENTEPDTQENSEQSDNVEDFFTHINRYTLFLSSLAIPFISTSNSLLAAYFKILLPPPEL